MNVIQRQSAQYALIAVFVSLIAVGLALSLMLHGRSGEESSNKINVVSTIYPWANVAKNIGGDLVEVTTLTPPGVEPHEYEPTPQDLVKLNKADVVIVNGGGIDTWAEKTIDELRSDGVRVVRISDDVEMLPDGQVQDPHFWLDPIRVKQAAELLWRPLSLTTREDAPLHQGLEAYLLKLDQLDQAYRTGLMSCQRRDIVTTHNAFRYLANRYSLQNEYILGLSPEEDPSPQKIAEVTKLAKDTGVTTIFFETLVSPKLAQTIANEIGIQTAVLNPIEGLSQTELDAGKDYLQLMQENLLHLRTALNCQ